MKYVFTGKNFTVSDAVKERAALKIGRLEKLFPENAEIHVTFSIIKLDQSVEVTVPLQKRILRAQVTASDLYTAIDEVCDKLEKQMLKYKDRLHKKSRKDSRFKSELDTVFSDESALDELRPVIKKTKKFAMKPMDAEEAVMEMDLMGHGFYMFRNSRTDEINVVYKRKDGGYGLIEPEC